MAVFQLLSGPVLAERYTGANKEQIEEFSGGQLRHDPIDGAILIPANKLARHKINPGDYVLKDGPIALSVLPGPDFERLLKPTA